MAKRVVDKANFKVDSNKEELLALLDQIAEGVLTEWGLTVERYAKGSCPVDTGRLRNSITWALGGKGAAITEYRGSSVHGHNASTARWGIAGKPAPPPHEGRYSGTAPNDTERKRSVYVGTNVKYAQYVELGTSKMSPRPYLKPAVTNHISEYMDILKQHLDSAKEP